MSGHEKRNCIFWHKKSIPRIDFHFNQSILFLSPSSLNYHLCSQRSRNSWVYNKHYKKMNAYWNIAFIIFIYNIISFAVLNWKFWIMIIYHRESKLAWRDSAIVEKLAIMECWCLQIICSYKRSRLAIRKGLAIRNDSGLTNFCLLAVLKI